MTQTVAKTKREREQGEGSVHLCIVLQLHGELAGHLAGNLGRHLRRHLQRQARLCRQCRQIPLHQCTPAYISQFLHKILHNSSYSAILHFKAYRTPAINLQFHIIPYP